MRWDLLLIVISDLEQFLLDYIEQVNKQVDIYNGSITDHFQDIFE